jgi:hypothetical protein
MLLLVIRAISSFETEKCLKQLETQANRAFCSTFLGFFGRLYWSEADFFVP